LATKAEYADEGTASSTLLAGSSGLENAKRLVTEYKTGKLQHMTPELWKAKKIVDSTLHPGMA
jgi:hypothetical protein